jgi:hypothetical protein
LAFHGYIEPLGRIPLARIVPTEAALNSQRAPMRGCNKALHSAIPGSLLQSQQVLWPQPSGVDGGDGKAPSSVSILRSVAPPMETPDGRVLPNFGPFRLSN